MLRSTLLILIFSAVLNIQGQDTIRVMHYNGLNYGASGGACDAITVKNANLKKIIKYANPDLFSMNEIVTDMQGGENAIAKSILDNVLNSDGVTHFKRAYDTGVGSQVNMLFYNSDLLTLYTQDILTEDLNGDPLVRYIDIYRLFYKGNLPDDDTIYIDHVVAHLKAANTAADILERTKETAAVMHYLETHQMKSNRLISGDFNVKTSNEDAFQNLINPSNSSLRFNDPINQPGDWNNNSNFTHIHTQSTHTSGSCFSTGGFDDRFDFVLISNAIKGNESGLRYINGSYKAIGQDGNLFNQAMPTTGTGTVNATISSALYNLSDHLPVYMELYADVNSIGIPKLYKPKTRFWVNNPASDKIIIYQSGEEHLFQVELTDMQGHVLLTKLWNNLNDNSLYINDIDILKSGFYIIKISPLNGIQVPQSLKLIVQ